MRSQTIDDSFEILRNKIIFVNVLRKFCKVYSPKVYCKHFDVLIVSEYKNVKIVKYNVTDIQIFLVSYL